MPPLRTSPCVFNCSGPVHSTWVEHALRQRSQVILFRREPGTESLSSLPSSESLHVIGGELRDVLSRMRNSISLLVDDVGALHFADAPLELLALYYESLRWDGEAWIRFPKSFWVWTGNQHRIPLHEYLELRFPKTVKKLLPAEIGKMLHGGASSPDDWIRLKKDRSAPALFGNGVHLRASGATAASEDGHSPFLEFIEATGKAA
jgi:hypothetical protein